MQSSVLPLSRRRVWGLRLRLPRRRLPSVRCGRVFRVRPRGDGMWRACVARRELDDGRGRELTTVRCWLFERHGSSVIVEAPGRGGTDADAGEHAAVVLARRFWGCRVDV